MKVAGCKVGNGVFQKGRKARVMRDGLVIHTGSSFLSPLFGEMTDSGM